MSQYLFFTQRGKFIQILFVFIATVYEGHNLSMCSLQYILVMIVTSIDQYIFIFSPFFKIQNASKVLLQNLESNSDR